jgi:hypothetical protein
MIALHVWSPRGLRDTRCARLAAVPVRSAAVGRTYDSLVAGSVGRGIRPSTVPASTAAPIRAVSTTRELVVFACHPGLPVPFMTEVPSGRRTTGSPTLHQSRSAFVRRPSVFLRDRHPLFPESHPQEHEQLAQGRSSRRSGVEGTPRSCSLPLWMFARRRGTFQLAIRGALLCPLIYRIRLGAQEQKPRA